MSGLPAEFRDDLEELLFFSPDQAGSRDWAASCVSRFGTPMINTREGLVRAGLSNYPDAQSLFAIEHQPLHDRLVGAVIFHRDHATSITVAYLAVAHDYTMAASNGDVPLSIELCAQVMDIARRITGVTVLQLVARQGPFIRIPLHSVMR